MDRGAWQATVHGVTESDTMEWLNNKDHVGEHLSWRYSLSGANWKKKSQEAVNLVNIKRCSTSLVIVSSVTSYSLRLHELQHARPPCPSPTSGVYPNPCPLSWWCYLTISSSVSPFSSCLQSLPESGSFPMRWLFTSGGQSIGASASASVFTVNSQDWFPLGLAGLISLLSMGLSRVFSSTIVWKHRFFGAQPSLWYNSHIHTWLLEKP